MRVLVLGGSGFLGRHLLASFGDGVEAFAIARSALGAGKIGAAAPATRVLSAREAVALRFDRVVNLVVDYGRGGVPLWRVMQPNLVYPLELLELIDAAVVVNVSTALPADYSNYARSKKMLEQALRHLEQHTARAFINVHLHNMYGPSGETSELIGFALARMLANEPVEVSEGLNRRDFIFVDDVVAALTVILRRPDTFARGVPVPVGTGEATRLRDMLTLLREVTGSMSPIAFGARPGNPFEPPVLAADTAPLGALGWRPRFPLRAGLEATVARLAARN